MDNSNDSKTATGLYQGIIVTALTLVALMAVLLLRPGDQRPVVAVLPWFVPVIGSFNALVFFSVAFLAIGRHSVLRDPLSFWAGMGTVGFGVAFVFYVLSWPGLLPGGGSVIGDFPDAPVWIHQFGVTLFSVFLLASATISRPGNEDLAGRRLQLMAGAWILVLSIAFVLVLRAGRYLPLLLDSNGAFTIRLLAWNAAVAVLFTAGAVISARRCAKAGDAIFGYMSIAQMGFAFASFAPLLGASRYDFLWYLTRTVPTLSALIVFFGLLHKNMLRIRREKEKTARMMIAEEALRRSERELARELETARGLQELSTQLIQTGDSEELYEKILDTTMTILKSDFASIQMLYPERGTSGKLRLLGHRGFNRKAAEFWHWVRPNSRSACGEALRTGRRVAVSDIRTCDFMTGCEDMEIYLQTGIRAAQATPLFSRSGILMGVLSAHWREPHELTAGEIRSLDVLARQAADLIDRKRAEDELLRLNESLEQKVLERTQLAEARARQLQALAIELIEAEERERRRISQLLHEDLQQLIAAARFQLQMALGNPESDPILKEAGRLLEQSIDKSRRLSHELSPTMLDHAGLIDSLKWLANHMNKQFGLQVDLNVDAERRLRSLPLKIFLFRAVQELLFNVAKHSNVKKARIEVSSSEGNLIVSVVDKGRGFDSDIMNSFDAKHGFGLLSLRERAQYLGGGFDIRSAPGRGSRITLTVPMEPTESDTAEALSEADRRTPAGKSLSQSVQEKATRVMFVDDHQIMRQGLIRLIAGQPGVELAGEATNGREAVDLVRHLKPDVVLMDISMPEMDGVEATRRIKALYPDMRVIGLSMYEDDQLVGSMLQAGAEAFVSKTASAATLLEAIYGTDVPEAGGNCSKRRVRG